MTGNVVEFTPRVERRLRDVGLISESVTALGRLKELTGLNEETILNRALQVYAFVEEEKANGARLLVTVPGSRGDLREVTIG